MNEIETLPLEQISELRTQGLAPSKIARELHLRPAVVREAIRHLASQETAQTLEQTRQEDSLTDLEPLILCSVTSSWTAGLSGSEVDQFRSEHPELCIDKDSDLDNGLIQIILARKDKQTLRSSLFLIDPWCLGVKDAWGPIATSKNRIRQIVSKSEQTFEAEIVQISPLLARKIVYGAVFYARSLGFNPHRDFASAAEILGPPLLSEEIGIQFGRFGKPFFVEGPHDNSSKVLSQLSETVGAGQFDFITGRSLLDF